MVVIGGLGKRLRKRVFSKAREIGSLDHRFNKIVGCKLVGGNDLRVVDSSYKWHICISYKRLNQSYNVFKTLECYPYDVRLLLSAV